MRDANWHKRRQSGIGGSEAGIVLGISPFKSPLRLYKEKRGELPPEDIDTQPNVFWGNRLENIVAEEYQNRTGRIVEAVPKLCVHKKYPWMICNLDRRVTNVPRLIVEVKTTSVFAFKASDWGSDGSDKIPPYYYAQCQHNCEVAGADQCDMPILIGGHDFRLYHIVRDKDFCDKLIAAESAFMEAVRLGVEPPPINEDDLRLLFPNHKPGIHKDADEMTCRAWAELAKIKPELKRLKAIKKAHDFTIKAAMGNAEYLSFNTTPLATWRTGDNGRRTFRTITGGVDTGGDDDD